MKKVLALIMVLAMAFSLVAGGSKESKEAAVPAGVHHSIDLQLLG